VEVFHLAHQRVMSVSLMVDSLTSWQSNSSSD